MNIYTNFEQKIDYDRDDIIALFATAKGWEGKYRQIMQLGKQLPPLPQEYKQEHMLVKGCESSVWLHYQQEQQQEMQQEQQQDTDNKRYHFAADSDARIVKGLVVIILAAFNHKNVQQIGDFDIEGYFAELDLLKHLSPSRANGIHAIVQNIKSIA